MGVEHHRDITQKVPAERSDIKPIVCTIDQFVVFKLIQPVELVVEVLVTINPFQGCKFNE